MPVGSGQLCDSRLLSCCLPKPFARFRLVGLVRKSQGITVLELRVRPKFRLGQECVDAQGAGISAFGRAFGGESLSILEPPCDEMRLIHYMVGPQQSES